MHLVWFRHDLRRHDHPALHAAQDQPILPIFILDPHASLGAASRVWLHHALHALNHSLDGQLRVFRGDPQAILSRLLADNPIEAIYWQRRYEPAQIAQDTAIKAALTVPVHSINGALLWEPWTVLKADGSPYRVYTPFYRKGCLRATPPRPPLAEVKGHWVEQALVTEACSIDALGLLPKPLHWAQALATHWDICEAGAQARLATFLETGLLGYKDGRNFPAQTHVSRLSPYLHFGLISPHQVWAAVHTYADPTQRDADHFLSELGWREFSYYLLYHFPSLPTDNWQTKFDRFPWCEDAEALQRWQRGQTGYPIVDAGMRELWQTGYMHNRLRMIVGSFLVKNLLQDWRAGAAWFWDCLVDADLANNSASWQWVAGSGADAAPYFRIFNPITQSQKFDPEGAYIDRYVPELRALPLPHRFCPWQAPAEVLRQAGVQLGIDYPPPIVDLAQSRQQALTAFEALKA